ncbi:hypothetical protein EI553_08960 [Shigella sonnei]|nr:hypothetical protein [Shigella sonnei]QBJ58823.1 hypothetical protein EI553_08960 [Shigella sonnei]
MDIIVLCPVHAPSHPQHQSIRALQTIMRLSLSHLSYAKKGNDSNLLIVFYVQIMPDDFVMQLHRF